MVAELRAVLAAWVTLAFVSLGAMACGGEPDAPDAEADANADAEADAGTLSVTPPSIPFWTESEDAVFPPFQQQPCRPGYRQIEEGEISLCEPWPETGREDCPLGFVHRPGEPGCAPIGRPCPAGELPEELPADAVVLYVDDGAAAGGDGSLSAPYAQIGDALSAAPSLATVAIAKGSYDEVIDVGDGVRVRGACAEQTVIAPTFGAAGVAVRLSANTSIEDLAIRPVGVGIESSDDIAVVRGVHVSGATSYGIDIASGDVALNDVVVEDTARDGGGRGVGIRVSDARLTTSGVIVDGSATSGVRAARAQVSLLDLTVLDTSTAESGGFGYGVTFTEGTVGSSDNLLIERSVGRGLYLDGGAEVVVADAIIRDTAPLFGGREGQGVLLGNATLELSHVRVERSHSAGVLLNVSSSILRMSQFLVRDVETPEDERLTGAGAMLFGGSRLVASGGVIERCGGTGILTANEGTTLEVSDTLIRDIGPSAAGRDGRGIGVQLGTDAIIRSTVIQRVQEIGIFVAGLSTSALIRDVLVQDLNGQMSDGISGRGVSVERSGIAELERVRIARSREIGLIAQDASSELVGTDVAIHDTLPRACAETTCSAEPFGIGVGGYYSAQVDLSRFEVRRSDLCGLQLAEGATVDLREGLVTGAEIGACVQVDGYDLDRLSENVDYVDNGASLQVTSLPIPAPN